ncbi:MAG: 1-deoxy-D-xylulose-5-phosphate synthase, partial [Clostridia bacterium]|nr:1-deoxy-D-xylulose-5-phosphate synthase [Clostridia bacterium]
MLEQICGPSDLKKLDIKQLTTLCQEIREHLVATVTSTGGHLASNLGVVELTVALHYVFDIDDKFVWDVGHQSYVHKLLTGRQLEHLRKKDGVSGFCDPAESSFDTVVSGHAGTSISSAIGLATARDLDGKHYNVVAVLGDGALTNGEAYEALNNAKDKKMLIVLNDNGMSIGKNVGSLPKNLSKMRVGRYAKRKERLKRNLNKTPIIGKPIYKLLRCIKGGIKRLVIKDSFFDSFDIKYVGIVDGHDLKQLIYYLEK